MHLLVDEELLNTVFKKMKLSYERVYSTQIKHHRFELEDSGNFCLVSCGNSDLTDVVVVSMDEANLWKLDKFQSCYIYAKKYICICKESGEMTFVDNKEAENCCFAYFPREMRCHKETDLSNTLEDIVDYNEKNLQLPQCDIYLLIPGRVIDEQNNAGWENVDSCSD